MPQKTILIHLGDSERGWLLQFVSRARFKAKTYDRVVVYTEDWMEYLVEDFADEVILYKPLKGWRDRFLFNSKRPYPPQKIIDLVKPDKVYVPTNKHCTSKDCIPVAYGQIKESIVEDAYDILIHARDMKRGDWIDRKCGGHHNYKKWEAVVKAINRPVGCIGSRDGARHIKGTVDLRNMNLMNLCILMNRAKVVVGESSFPLHLASMCRTNHIVITHNRVEKSIKHTNRWRYKVGWNPLKTDCKIIEHPSWQPKPEAVIEAIKHYL